MAQVPFAPPSSFIPQELRNQLGAPQPAQPVGLNAGNGDGKAPRGLRSLVKMTGVTSLPEAESIQLQKALGTLSECLMQLTEMQNDASLPNNIRGERMFYLMPQAQGCLADVLRLGGVELGVLQGSYREEAIEKHKHAFELQQHINHICVPPASPELCVKTQDDARVVSSLALGVIEHVMEIFGIADRAILDRIKEIVMNVKQTILDICNEFITGKDAAQIAEYVSTNAGAVAKLVEYSNRYSMLMTDLLKAYISRMAFLPSEMVRGELNTIIMSLRDMTPKLILVAQGKLVEPGIVDKLLGAVDEGFELVKMIPRFSARVEMEFIGGGALEMASAALRNSVASLAVSDIGATARAYALEVSNVVSQCRQMGVNAIDCDEVQRALANAIKLAKAAVTSGDAQDIRNFEAALEELNKLVAALPTKFKLVFYEESSDAFDAAKELLNTGLVDFISGMQ